MDKLEELTLEELEQKLAQVNKEQEKIERQRKVLKSEINTNIRKARNRLLIRLGGDWLKLRECSLKDETKFERVYVIQSEIMKMVYNSLPHCPECGNELLKLKNGDWRCTKKSCGKTYKSKNGNPDFFYNNP